MPIEYGKLEPQWEAFLKQSSLEVIVPQSSEVRASEICVLSAAEADRLPTRQALLYDEQLTVQLILRSRETRSVVEEWMPFLEFSVTAHATNAASEGAPGVNPAAPKYDVDHVKLEGTSHAAIQVSGPTCNVVWTALLRIHRPRTNLQRPSIYFVANLSISAATAEKITALKPDYMPSYQTSPANVLEALRFTPDLAGSNLYVSEERITKMAPVLQQDNAIRSLRGVSKRVYPVIAALYPALQCSAIPGGSMAALQLEASPMLVNYLEITSVKLDVKGMEAKQVATSVPVEMRPGDELSVLYELTDREPKPSHNALVTVTAKVQLERGEIDIESVWQLPFETQAQDSTSHHTWSRIGHARKEYRPDKSEPVIFTFTAPAAVSIGETFNMQVQCVNHSQRHRHFTVLPQAEAAGVLVHTPVVKLRNVAPGACYEADISYSAVQQGVVRFGRIEVVDVDLQSAFYVDELPDVIAG